MAPDRMPQDSKRDQLYERLTSCESIVVSGAASEYDKKPRQNQHNKNMPHEEQSNSKTMNHLCVKSMVRCTGTAQKHRHINHQVTLNSLVSLLSLSICLVVTILSATSTNYAHQTQVNAAELSTSSSGGVALRMANKLQTEGARLARKLELAKSGGQINEWLVHQVAPAMANKLINNVLQSPKSSIKTLSSGDSSSKKSAIDTQALADKIVDKLADSIKKKQRKKQAASASQEVSSGATAAASSAKQQTDEPTKELASNESSLKVEPTKSRGANRKGKSLVGDSVHQVVQNLFSKDNRKLFGRAMEKSRRHGVNNLMHNSSNSWMIVKEPVYDQHLFVSTDSSQLDENPVVLRAEHGHNLTTTDSSIQHNAGQNLSPLISSLMSNTATNQIGNKLLQKHRLQQKYVHTNRHHQQHLAPKPWPAPNAHNRRHQQQSPYSLSVTSDINIVQAPSSPAPPPVSSSTTTSTTTTTTSSPPPTNPPFSFVAPPATVTQLGPNKFKINNRHQYPQSSVPLSASSWYSSNRNHQQPQSAYNQAGNNNHRYQHHHPSTTSTSTTTTTTTTTTTPEPPQTDPPMTESIESMPDLDQQTSAPVSSILSSVAQSALESLTQSGSDESSIYNPFSNSSYGHSSSSSASPLAGSQSLSGSSSAVSSSGAIKGASPSTTTARHSVISAEAIPTALGAPLYHLTRANFTATSIMAPPPRRSGSSPAAKLAAQYFQKGLNNLSSTIFGRQSKNWARRLGLSSVLLSGLLYGAAILANPGAPLPTNGLGVLQALTKGKRRRGSRESLLPPIGDPSKLAQYPIPAHLNAALLDNNVNFLYQQPQFIPIIEHIIQQEQQQQQQQSSLFSQRSFDASPIEIESFDND